MAWSFVGGTVAPNTNTVTRSVTSGNLLIVGAWGANNDTLTISDGVNTWTRIGSQLNDTTNNNSLTWWWAAAATTASITVTISGMTATTATWIGEWNSSNGNVASTALDVATQNSHFTNNSGSSAADGDTSGSITTTQNGDLIVCWIADTQSAGDGTTFFTAGTNFTSRAGITHDSVIGDGIWHGEDLVQATAGAITGTWTCKNTDAYGCLVGGFKEPAASGDTLMGAILL